MRDVKEETGLDVLPTRKLYTQPADTKIKTVSFWTADVIGGNLDLNRESSGHGWFTVDEALQLELYPGTRAFLEQVQRGDIDIV